MSGNTSREQTLLPPGTVLDGRFEIKEFIGAGSFGAVYRATQLIFGHPMRNVALKLFKGNVVTRQNVAEVFGDAVTLIGLCENAECPPEIARRLIQVYDIGVIEQPTAQAYLTMKLVSGGQTLKNAIRRWGGSGGMAVDTALRFLRQLLEPLAWMHMLHPAAVHGDLKPDNVLMTEQSDLVLTDFGLAERLPLGARGGAIQYQAPETLIGGAGGAPADVYGVGLIWYEMMTGRQPFDEVGGEALGAGDDRAFVQAHHAARKWTMRRAQPHHFSEADPRIVTPSEINEELREHPRLEAMLARCLSFRGSDRYPNARLLLDDINRYVGAAPSQSAAASPVLAVVPGKPAVAATATPTKSHEARLQDVLALAAAGRTDEALSQAEKMASEQPRHVPTLLTLARSQLKAGLLEKAQLTCATVQRLDPRNADVLDVLAEIAEAKGQHTAARALRDQANERRRAPAVRR